MVHIGTEPFISRKAPGKLDFIDLFECISSYPWQRKWKNTFRSSNIYYFRGSLKMQKSIKRKNINSTKFLYLKKTTTTITVLVHFLAFLQFSVYQMYT